MAWPVGCWIESRLRTRRSSPVRRVRSSFTAKLPPIRDAQAGMSSAAIAIDQAARLEDRQGDGKVAAAQSLQGTLFETLKNVHGDAPDGSG